MEGVDERVLNRLDGELHIRRPQRFPIMPVHALAQVKYIGIGLWIVLHRRGERGDDGIVLVAAHQPVEQQLPDLGVLIHQYIDLLVVLCGIDELRPVRLIGTFPAAAARKYQQCKRHAQKQQLLHLIPPFIKANL